jgi:hypothetical protein
MHPANLSNWCLQRPILKQLMLITRVPVMPPPRQIERM